MRNNKGVTLTSLVIMIIVITILTSVTIYTGFELYETSRANAFKAEMQTIQERVNLKCQNLSSNGISIDDFIQDFTLASGATTNSGKRVEETDAIENLEQNGIYVDLDQYVYLNKDSIRDKLGLEGIDAEVLINFYTRDIINLKGVKYNDTIYYRLIDISKEYKNIEYSEDQFYPNDTSVEISKRCYGINTTFEIMNDEVSEVYIGERLYDINGDLTLNVKSWEVVPKEKRVFKANVSKTGVYDFKILFKDGTEKIFHDNKVELCNAPELSTGMIPVMWIEDDTSEKGGYWKRIDQSNSDEMGQWYDYSEKKWANIMLKDGMVENEMGQIEQEGSMFVWIPRFMYQITKYNNDENTGYQKNQAGVINIKFMLGNSNLPADKSNIKVSKIAGSDKWIVHPCFKDGHSNNYQNGEWSEEINGIWVAKYPAGYQANTISYDGNMLSTNISNIDDTVEYSNITYTSYEEEEYLGNDSVGNNVSRVETNPLGQDLTSTGYSISKIPYPVFKPLTYAFNIISIGDCYVISQEVAKAKSFYGLDSNFVDSHLMKNSEWGAVTYLTYSKYGRNREEVNINNYYTDTKAPFRVAVTGIYSNETNNNSSNTLSDFYAYNTEIGNKGSSTGNITGIFDLNGCVWERVAAYISNGDRYLKKYGNTFVLEEYDIDGYKKGSTRYSTIYPFSANESGTNNYNEYKNKEYGYGDAILEISTYGYRTGWNSDYTVFPENSVPFIVRGGAYYNNNNSGIFSYYSTFGYSRAYYSGFRVVLINSEPLPSGA